MGRDGVIAAAGVLEPHAQHPLIRMSAETITCERVDSCMRASNFGTPTTITNVSHHYSHSAFDSLATLRSISSLQ